MIFLSGLPRTGSTLLTSILTQNPDIHAEEKRRKEAEAEQMQWAVAIVIIVMFIGAVGWGINEVSDLCARSRCGR